MQEHMAIAKERRGHTALILTQVEHLDYCLYHGLHISSISKSVCKRLKQTTPRLAVSSAVVHLLVLLKKIAEVAVVGPNRKQLSPYLFNGTYIFQYELLIHLVKCDHVHRHMLFFQSYRMEEEEPAVPVEDHAPVFSEEARIYTVDTVEGLICTHEVMQSGCEV